jgi:hypothetical protein
MVRFSPTFQTVYHLVSTEFAPWLATRITLLSKCLSLNVELRTIVITSPLVKDLVVRARPVIRAPVEVIPLLTLRLQLILHRQLQLRLMPHHLPHLLRLLLPRLLEDVVAGRVEIVARGDFKMNEEGH